jgi:chemotaxis protein histidine kinase CheA
MDPEKQKQIMGYFIEESRDHLNTIEGGLLNLQAMLSDTETLNEVFRAAHSIKGGAAMLGITSVQQTAHHLEDYFKVLKDNSHIPTDQNLQTLFLQAFDRLQELLDQLQSPFGLTKDVADEIMATAEPIYNQLKTYLHKLITLKPSATGVVDSSSSIAQRSPAPSPAAKSSGDTSALFLVFQSDVPAKLRDMLQLFKQPDRPTSRQNLQAICNQLCEAGEQFALTQWCDMVRAVRSAIASQNNSYRVLAPVVIKEIKQSQELVLARRAHEVTVSPQLRNLMPHDAVSSSGEDEISSIFGAVMAEENKVSAGWKSFGDRIGWNKNGAWIRTANLSYTDSAPEGHLPAPIWLSAWDKPKDSNADELRNQYTAFMAKISECEVPQ